MMTVKLQASMQSSHSQLIGTASRQQRIQRFVPSFLQEGHTQLITNCSTPEGLRSNESFDEVFKKIYCTWGKISET